MWIESKGSHKPQDKQFGPFMCASQTVNTRKSVVHVSSFFEDRRGHQSSGEKQKASSGVQSESSPPVEKTGPPPSGEQADLETLLLAVDVINAVVYLDVSRLRTDVDLTKDSQGKAVSSPPSADKHQPIESDVSTSGGSSMIGDAELFPKTLNLVLLQKSMGTYTEGDPFLEKLQEIDSDIQKYDQVSCENKGCLEDQPDT